MVQEDDCLTQSRKGGESPLTFLSPRKAPYPFTLLTREAMLRLHLLTHFFLATDSADTRRFSY